MKRMILMGALLCALLCAPLPAYAGELSDFDYVKCVTAEATIPFNGDPDNLERRDIEKAKCDDEERTIEHIWWKAAMKGLRERGGKKLIASKN